MTNKHMKNKDTKKWWVLDNKKSQKPRLVETKEKTKIPDKPTHDTLQGLWRMMETNFVILTNSQATNN